MPNNPDLQHLQARLRQTRALIVVLGACVLALAVTMVWFVRRPQPKPPYSIVLTGASGQLVLRPDRIELHGDDGHVAVLMADDLVIRKRDERRVELSSEAGLELVAKDRSIKLDASHEATLELRAAETYVTLEARGIGAELRLAKAISAHVGATGAHLLVEDGEEAWSSILHTRKSR